MVKAEFIGRLATEIDIRLSKDGKTAIGNFTLACDTGFGERKKSNFYRCVAFGKMAENLQKYASKGSKLYIDAEPQQDRWQKDGNNYSEIKFYVKAFEFVESKNSNENRTNVVTDEFMNIPDNVDDAIQSLPFV